MAARSKAPAFQFYPQDFIMGCAMMSAEEVGGYIRLLCYQWEHGSVPDDDAMLCRLTGCGGNAVASIRHKFGICQEGRLANARLEQVRAEQDEYRKRQADNASKRWSKGQKSCGGNAIAMPSQCGGNAAGVPPHMPEGMPNVCPTPTTTPTINTLRLEAEPQPDAQKEQKPKKERQRNPLIDALATVGGESIEEVTSPTFSRAAAALKMIREVMPNVTVEEIKRRAGNYLTHYPNAAITSTALAKNWATAARAKFINSQSFSAMPISNDRFDDTEEALFSSTH